jgi:hypothetical protein
MAAKKPGMSLGDAMKAAKKTYKKGKTGGTLMEKMGPMGGRRRGTRKAKVGGVAYGFTGGPYTNSELADGAGRFPAMPDATWQGPSELKGGRRSRRLSKKALKALKALKGGDGSQLAPVSPGGKPADLPLAQPSVAPASHQSSGPVGPADEGAKSGPASVGGRRGRRSRRSKKMGRGYY